MNKKFFWRLDKDLPITLSIQRKRDIDSRIRVFGTIKLQKTLLASCDGICYEEKFKVFNLMNHLRTNYTIRSQIPFIKRNSFNNLAAWLLEKVICHLFPLRSTRRRISVSLIADGYLIDDQKRVVINPEKLVQYYEKLGFERDIDFEIENVMKSNAETVFKIIKNF